MATEGTKCFFIFHLKVEKKGGILHDTSKAYSDGTVLYIA